MPMAECCMHALCYDLQPEHVITFIKNIKRSNSQKIKWYMCNVYCIIVANYNSIIKSQTSA